MYGMANGAWCGDNYSVDDGDGMVVWFVPSRILQAFQVVWNTDVISLFSCNRFKLIPCVFAMYAWYKD